MYNQSQQQRDQDRFHAYQHATHCRHLMLITTVAEGRVDTKRFSHAFPAEDLRHALQHCLAQFAEMYRGVDLPVDAMRFELQKWLVASAARLPDPAEGIQA